jgi:hypothetical protein
LQHCSEGTRIDVDTLWAITTGLLGHQNKVANIQPKSATRFLIHLINIVESSDKVSQLLKKEFNHYRHERSLLDFQRNAVFHTLNDQSKSVYSCSLISLLKPLLYALQCPNFGRICTAGDFRV